MARSGGIDRLDEDLVRLFAERAAFIDRAAEIKAEVDRRGSRAGRGGGGRVRRHAATYGPPPDLVEALAAADRLVDRARESRLGGQPPEG